MHGSWASSPPWGVAAAWAARSGSDPSRRLALAAMAGLAATLLADLVGYPRPERWIEPAILLAAVAAGGLSRPRSPQRSVRPAWALLGVAFLIIFAVLTVRVEVLPLAVWLLWWPRRTWAAAGAVAWSGVLIWVPLWAAVKDASPPDPAPDSPLTAVAAHGGPGAGGLVDLDALYNTAAGDVRGCPWGHPWQTTADTGGRIRPLFGLYGETSAADEFLVAETSLRAGTFDGSGKRRPHWFDAWEARGRPTLDSPAAAAARGARWYATCDAEGKVSVTEVGGANAGGVTVAPYAGDDAWHRAAVDWWLRIATGPVPPAAGDGGPAVPVRSSGESVAHPLDRGARGVWMSTGEDRLIVHADEAGWAWLRVPWDPDWRSVDGTPVRKGGPGHLVVWAERGVTELVWGVPRAVDVAAAATTGGAALAAAALVAVARRRPFEPDPCRRRPAAEALDVFGATVDGWAYAATRRARRLLARARRGPDRD